MTTIQKRREICSRWNLYVITDIILAAPKSYNRIVRDVLMGGANVIQIRDKVTPFDELVETGRKLKPIFEEFAATFLINDNPYLAREVDADGVHLGQSDIPPDIAREIVGNDKIIGLSTHNKQQAIQAMYLDVDYIGIGPVFKTTTKESENKPVGVELVRWVTSAMPTMPTVPIGGINLNNIASVSETGATAPAVISAAMKSEDIESATRGLLNNIHKARDDK